MLASLALGSSTGRVYILEPLSVKASFDVGLANGAVMSLAYRPVESGLAIGLDCGRLCILDVSAEAVLHDIDLGHGSVEYVTYDLIGNSLATQCTEHVCIIQPDSGTVLHRVHCGSTFGNDLTGSVAYAPDGQLLAACCDMGHVFLIHVRGGAIVQAFNFGRACGGSLAFSPTGESLALIWWSPCRVCEIQLRSGIVLFNTDISVDLGKPRVVAYNPIGGSFAVGSETGCIIESTTGVVLHRLPTTHGSTYHLAYKATGETLVVGFDDGYLAIVGSYSGNFLHVVSIGANAIDSLAYLSGDADIAACAGGTVAIVDSESGTIRHRKSSKDFGVGVWILASASLKSM